jgi:GntR family transcriptional regulator/MocR family aminotransferase
MRAVRCGRLLAGERLPSSRDLARELGVSRGMVVACYESCSRRVITWCGAGLGPGRDRLKGASAKESQAAFAATPPNAP